MDSLPFFINNLGPAIVRRLSSATGGDFDITTGQSFKLRVRARDSSVLLLDKTMTPNVTENTVTYQPTATDTPFINEGTYRAWVYYVEGKQDTDEFEIRVFSHAPGQLTRIGAIWRAARALEPVAWDALRSYPDYGDVELQRVIELAKLRVIGSPLPPVADEASIDPRVVDYIAKKVLADNVLYAAISFWTNQVVQQSARGNSDEVVTYPDRIRAAEEAIKRYREDLERQEGELPENASGYNAPALLNAGPMLTPGLDEYPAQPIRLPYWLRSARG